MAGICIPTCWVGEFKLGVFRWADTEDKFVRLPICYLNPAQQFIAQEMLRHDHITCIYPRRTPFSHLI